MRSASQYLLKVLVEHLIAVHELPAGHGPLAVSRAPRSPSRRPVQRDGGREATGQRAHHPADDLGEREGRDAGPRVREEHRLRAPAVRGKA